MKKLNFTHFTPIILLTLLVTGCLPDSLTKWKKDPPQKPVASSTLVPVVDSSGKKLTFTAPTYFTYTQGSVTKFNLQVNLEATGVTASYDGSLKDKTNGPKFIIGCALDSTGDAQTKTLPAGLSIDSATCNISGTPTATTSIASGKEFCSDPLITTQADCIVTPFTWDATAQKCSNPDFKYQNQTDCEAGLNTWYSKGDAIPYRIKFSYKDADGYPHDIYTTVPIGVYSKITAVRYTFADKLLLGVTPADPQTSYTSIVPVKTTGDSSPYTSTNLISAQNGVQGVINYVNATQNFIGVHPLLKITLDVSVGSNGYAYFKAGHFVKADTTSVSGREVTGRIYKTDTANPNVIYIENISSNEAYFSKGDTLKYYKYSGGWQVQPAQARITSIDDTYYFSTKGTPDLDNDEQYYGSDFSLKSTPVNSYTVGKSIKPLKAILDITPDASIVFTVSPKLPDGLSLDSATGTISGTFSKSTSPTAYNVTATNPLGAVSNTVRLISSDAPADLSISNRQVITVSNTAFFTEGETLRQPTTVSAGTSTSTHGTILKILNGYQMAIEVHNGKFSQKASLDSGATYLAEKAFIIPDNSCVNTAYTTKTACEAAGFIWSTGDIFYSFSAAAKYTGLGVAPTFSEGECRLIDTNGVDGGPSADNNKRDCESNSKEGSLQIWLPTRIINSALPTATSAYGVIAKAIKVDTSNWILFISHNTASATGFSDAKKFSVGDTVYKYSPSTATYGTTDFTLQSLDSNSVVLTVASLTGFSAGGEVTLADNAAYPQGKVGGYIYKTDSSSGNKDVYLSDVSFAPQRCSDATYTSKASCIASGGICSLKQYFKSSNCTSAGGVWSATGGTWYEPALNASVAGDSLFNNDTVVGATNSTTINKVSHDILIIGERGKSLYFNASNSSSGSSTYTVSPDLPSGLKLNSNTGEITGSPTVAMQRREFVIKATNFVDQASFVFAMEVRDYFSLSQASSAQSFIIHKTGATRFKRECRINSTDIQNATGGIDIRCYLEGEEEDLFFTKIKFSASAGPGVCDYVEYAPYYFWKYAPFRTTSRSVKYITGCTPAGGDPAGYTRTKPTTGSMCKGNQGALCDEGSYQLTTKTYKLDQGTCTESDTTVETVSCGGDKISNCMVGPIKDLLSDAKIKQGLYSQIYATDTAGYTGSWELSSPYDKTDLSNLRVANSGAANRCSFSDANQVDTWVNATAGTSSIQSPWGESNPYYTFNCLDGAQEIKGRIRVVVRDWDKNFNITNDIDNDQNVAVNNNVYYSTDIYGSNSTKDVRGTSDNFSRPYNNFNDWDDDFAAGGFCSNPIYTTEYNCILNKGVWTPGTCQVESAYDSATCTTPVPALPASVTIGGTTYTVSTNWISSGAQAKKCLIGFTNGATSIKVKTQPHLFAEACHQVQGKQTGIASFKYYNSVMSKGAEISCTSSCTNGTDTTSGACTANGEAWIPYHCVDLTTGLPDLTKDSSACNAAGANFRWMGVMPGCAGNKNGYNQESCGVCLDNTGSITNDETKQQCKVGSCSNPKYLTSTACTGAQESWTDAAGTCSDGTSTTVATCTAAGGTWTYTNIWRASKWTPGGNYSYPGTGL